MNDINSQLIFWPWDFKAQSFQTCLCFEVLITQLPIGKFYTPPHQNSFLGAELDKEKWEKLVVGIEYDPCLSLEALLQFSLKLEFDEINIVNTIRDFIGMERGQKQYSFKCVDTIDPDIDPKMKGKNIWICDWRKKKLVFFLPKED